MLEIRPEDRFRLKDSFVLHQIPDLEKYWLFDLANGDQYALNEVSMLVLQALQQGATFEELVGKVLEEYGVGNEEARDDIKELLVQLLGDCIIVREEND